MRIAIIGIGAMGCLFGAWLESLAGVALVGTWPEQLTTLQTRGLRLLHPDGHQTHHALRTISSSQISSLGKVDVALILVKSYQTEAAARQVMKILSANGLALTLQNGVGNLEKMSNIIEPVLGPHHVALGVTSQGATVLAPGMVQHAGHGPTHLAYSAETVKLLTAVAALFQQAGVEIKLTNNVDSLLWGKLAVSSGINPLTALLRVPNGFLVDNEHAGRIMSLAAEETAAVARAYDIQLPFASATLQAQEVARSTANNYSSMLQDVLRGAPTEIDSICGAVVDYGRHRQVPTPINEKLLLLVKALESGSGAPPYTPEDALETLLTSFAAGGTP